MAKRPKSKKDSGNSVVSAMAAIDHTNNRSGGGFLDDAFTSAVTTGQEKQACDGQVFSANEVLAQLICLQMPALAPRFLMQSEGWPLGRFFLIDGFKESCKSAFLNEVGVWHRNAGGNYVVIETENKDGSGLRDSFFNYDRNAWKFTRAFTQDAWNRAYFWWVEKIVSMYDGRVEVVDDEKSGQKKVKVPGIGRIAPVCLAVDSISAVTIEKFEEAMLAEGNPSLNHPLGAKLLSDFMKVGPKQLNQYPISFMAVSHLREGQDQRTHAKTRTTTGGEAPKYQMTTEIEMKRRKAGQFTRTHKIFGDIYSIDLSMIVRKNSLGGHEHIDVEMCWYFDPDDRDPINGEKRQKSFFDWHSSSIELLVDCMKPGDAGMGFSSRRAKELKELIDLHRDDDRRQVSSKVLGISDKDKLPYREAGKILEDKIQSDPAFCTALYDIMGIRRRFMFQYGVDLREQIAQNLARLREAEIEGARRLMEEPVAEPS